MEPVSEIRKSIKTIASSNWKATCFIAKVVDVNGEECTIEIDGLQLTDVRLRAVVNGETSKILITPKKDSYVLVTDMMGDMSQLVVVNFSEIEKIEIDADKIVFNGGDNHGLVNIDDLVKRLNNIERDITSLKTAILEWVPVSQDGGVALKGALSDWLGNELAFTMREDMEDTKITH